MSISKKTNHLSTKLMVLSLVVILAGVIGISYVGNVATTLFDTHTKSLESEMTQEQLPQLETISLEKKQQFSDEQWKEYLSPKQFAVLRQAGTETPFTGEYLGNKQKGTYVTADCGEPVFRSEQKYDSKTGWPSFWAPIDEDSVELRVDTTGGIERTEVVSKKCGSHLGHVFDDGPDPTGKRYCINSVALKFIPDEE